MAFKISDIPLVNNAAEVPSVKESFTTAPMGIPQSSAPPAAMMDTFGTSPWESEEASFNEATTKWYREGQTKLDAAVLDPEKGFADIDLSFAPDPETARRQVVTDAWMDLNHDEPAAPSELQRRVQFQVASLARFGEMVDSEEALYPLIQKDATKRKDAKALATDLNVSAYDDAMLPGDKAPGYAAFREKLKTHPGYDPASEADYAEAWYQTRAEASARVDAFREPLIQVWRAFKTDGNITAAAFDAYKQLTPEQRPEFMDAMAIRAKALPDEERATFWKNLRQQTGLAVSDYGRNAAESAVSMGTAIPTDPGVGIADAIYGGNLYATSEAGRKQAGEDFQQARNFAADVRKIAREDYDPLKSADGSGNKPGFWEGVAYQIPGVTATSLTMAVPVVGMATMTFAMEGQAYEDMRGRMLAAGKSDEEATKIAEGLAPLIAAPQAALEKVGFGIWSRKLPGFTKVIDALGDKIANRALRFGVKTATIGTAETGIELAQDSLVYGVQDIAAALTDDVPEVDWSKELKGTWASAPEIFATMLPLAILGAAGGLNAESRNAAFARATPTELQALGIDTDGIAAINAANGPSSLATAIDSAMETRDPNSETAQAAVGAIKLQLETQRRAQADLENLGYAAPSFVQHADGITVFDGEGKELGTAPDLSGAVRIARAHTTALDNLEADQVAALGTLMEAAKAAVELDPSSTVDVSLGQFDPETASPDMAARFAAQVALKEQAEGGTGDIARSVLGYSVTEMAQGVRNTVNRLFQGAAVTDVFHENFHGLRRQARAAGTITRADEIAMLRALDTVMAGKMTKDGVQLRFIPENMTDEQVSETLLDEAFSEIAEMEILRTRKGAGKGKLGLTRGVISRNLTALSKLIPGVAGKWTAFMAAVRARWGLSLSRALAMKKAERDGTFDKQGYDAYLDKILGLDQQTEHDAGVKSELDRILALPEEIVDDDISFSIGSNEHFDSGINNGAIKSNFSPKNLLERLLKDYAEEIAPPPPIFQESNWDFEHKGEKLNLSFDESFGETIRSTITNEDGEIRSEETFDLQEDSDGTWSIGPANGREYETDLDEDWYESVPDAAWQNGQKAYLAEDSPTYYTIENYDETLGWHDSPEERTFSLEEAVIKYSQLLADGAYVRLAYYDGNSSSTRDRDNFLDKTYHSVTLAKPSFVSRLLEEFPGMSKDEAQSISDNRNPNNENPFLVAQAYARHRYTDYETQLRDSAMMEGDDRASDEARRVARVDIREDLDAIMERWSQPQVGNGSGSSNTPETRKFEGMDDDIPFSIGRSTVTPSAETQTFEGTNGEIVIGPAAFSIGPAKVASIMEGNALKRITDPRRRTHVMSRIARDFGNMRLQIERMASLSGIRRSKGDMRREANAREDLRAEELIADVHRRFGEIMADDDLVKIKSQPVHSALADPTSPLRGRLKSKAAAIREHPDMFQLHRAGDYDGSDGVSRSVFGGQRMPDQAAQELYDSGLIPEPTADALWEALLSEQKTVDGMKELLEKAKEQIREAKAQAKQEANEWLATQGKDQEVNFSDKEEIRRSLRMLDAILLALPPEIRGKIGGYTQISMIGTDEARLAYLKDKLAKADKELETFLRVEYAAEWEALLAKAAPKTNEAGQRPTGSIAADAYDIFRVAESAMGMDFAGGEAEADKWDAIADHPDTDIKDVDMARVKAQMIRLTMNWSKADAARREQAVLEGEKIYYQGLLALKVEASRRRERLGKLRDSAVRGTGKTGHRMEREAAKQETATKLGALKAMRWEFLSFGQVVNVLFGEKSAAAQWFNSREIAASNAAHDGFQAKANSLESLFDTLSGNRFDGEKLRHRMATDPKIKVQDVLGIDHTFTESQAITFLLMYRQEDGKRHLQGVIDEETGTILSEWAWDDASATTIEAGLSPEGRAAMAFLGQSYGEEYGRINDVFRRIWNVSMPRHKMYAPLSVKPVQGKGDTIMDPVSGDTMGAGMTPGSLKNRSFSAIAEPDFKDAFQVYLTHARQMEHFIAYGEFSRDALAIINRRETRNAIEAAGGADAAGTLSKWVDYFALGGVHGAAMGGAWSKMLGGMLGRLSQAALVGRVSVLCMQSLQLAAASFKMPTGAFLTRFAKLSAGRLQWGDTIKSEYIQRRLSQLPPVVRDMMQGMASGTPNRAKYLAGQLGQTIPGADALFTAGTYAIFYDYHLGLAKKDKTITNPQAHAHAEAERLTDQVAQPTRTGARSWLEVANAGNPAFRAAWNFSSDPRQKMSLLVYAAMRRDTTGKEKAADVAFTAAKLWIIGGVMQTLLRTVLRDLRNDDDDEVFDERYWSPARLALQVITGPLGAVPFLGGMMEDLTYKLTGQYAPQGGMLAFLDQAASLPQKWAKGKVEPIKDLETLTTAGAGFSGTSAAAASAMHIIRDVVGFIENLEGSE